MTVTRDNAAAYLDYRMSNIAAQVQQASTDDSATGYGPDIDAALRQLGFAESSLATAVVSDSDRVAFFTLARYYALERFAERVATRVDTGTPGERTNRRIVFQNIMDLIENVAEQAAGLGYPVDGTPSWVLDDLNLDFVEPDPTRT